MATASCWTCVQDLESKRFAPVPVKALRLTKGRLSAASCISMFFLVPRVTAAAHGFVDMTHPKPPFLQQMKGGV